MAVWTHQTHPLWTIQRLQVIHTHTVIIPTKDLLRTALNVHTGSRMLFWSKVRVEWLNGWLFMWHSLMMSSDVWLMPQEIRNTSLKKQTIIRIPVLQPVCSHFAAANGFSISMCEVKTDAASSESEQWGKDATQWALLYTIFQPFIIIHMLWGYSVSHMMVFDCVCVCASPHMFPAAAGHIARSDPGGRGSVHSEARHGSWFASKRSSGVCAARAQCVLSATGSQHAKGHRAAS